MLQLRAVSYEGEVSYTDITDSLSITAEPRTTYSVVDSNQQAIGESVLVREGDDLVVQVDNQTVVRIEEFYADNSTSAFDVGTVTESGEAVLITPSESAQGVVWEASGAIDYTAALVVGAAVVGVGAIVDHSSGGDNNDQPLPSAPKDTTPPNLAISSDTVGAATGDVIFTFTFDETVSGFDASDITVSGGTKGTFTAVSGTEYTLVVTPDANSTANITVDVAADVATDAAGNGNTAATQVVQTVDTQAPSLTITDDTAGTANGDVTFTFTFDEAVTGFDATDITVSGGTKGTFTAVSGTEYTLVVTPDANSTADITVDVAADVATDAVGNGNTAATQAVQPVDTMPPADPTIVIFDLINGVSSDHSGQTFQSGVDYEIYILVDSTSPTITMGAGEVWSGTANLGAGDQITLVGNDATGVYGGRNPANSGYVQTWGPLTDTGVMLWRVSGAATGGPLTAGDASYDALVMLTFTNQVLRYTGGSSGNGAAQIFASAPGFDRSLVSYGYAKSLATAGLSTTILSTQGII